MIAVENDFGHEVISGRSYVDEGEHVYNVDSNLNEQDDHKLGPQSGTYLL